MNIITTFTQAERRVIKHLKIEDFFVDSIGAFVFDFDEARNHNRLGGTGFYTRVWKAFNLFNNTKRTWVFDTVDEDGDIYILYKTNR
jgi:hypothetical protein